MPSAVEGGRANQAANAPIASTIATLHAHVRRLLPMRRIVHRPARQLNRRIGRMQVLDQRGRPTSLVADFTPPLRAFGNSTAMAGQS
jgi:hypothetical protein